MGLVAGVHHVGIPVRDLGASLEWYTNVLGLVDTGMRGGGDGEVISHALKVDGADVQVAFLRAGDALTLELIEYRSPKSPPHRLRNNDLGAMHVCFAVDDIRATYARLKDAGVTLHHEPIPLDESAGDLAGYSFMYFQDPDGITLELFELPAAA